MKKLVSIILIFTAVAISSCEGPMGPPGYDGLDGDSFIGSIFEIEGDFKPTNDYRLYFDFPNSFTMYDTDVVLVYMLWEQANGLDVWRLMPQTILLPDGVLQYNFDYTLADVQIFLEGTTDFNKLLPAETNNQIFRIAVLPADFAAKKSVDINDINTILNSPILNLSTIEKIQLNTEVK